MQRIPSSIATLSLVRQSVKQADQFQAAILADVAGRRGVLHGSVESVSSTLNIAGPAITGEIRPGRQTDCYSGRKVSANMSGW